LVSKWISEVISIDVTEIVCFWDQIVRNVIGRFIAFIPRLDFIKSFFEIISGLGSEFLSLLVLLNISTCLSQTLGLFLGFTMGPIIDVVLLELTDVCLPPKICLVDKSNSSICFICRFMILVGIETLLVLLISVCSRSNS